MLVVIAMTTMKMMTFKFTDGDRPFHVHTCTDPDGNTEHTWECNSAYCSSTLRDCPDHHGRMPVYLGEEPWRK